MTNRKAVFVACAVTLLLSACADTSGYPQASAPLIDSNVSTPPTVPDGPLTPTGTTLAFGETARVMYEVKMQATEKTKVGVTQVSVAQGSISDFRDVDLEPDVVDKEFFYVTMAYANLGPLPLDPAGITGSMTADDTAGEELSSLTVFGEFGPCKHIPDSESLAVGEVYTGCSVLVAPRGQDISAVRFRHFEDQDYNKPIEITWPVK